jgi:hypothetical protein
MPIVATNSFTVLRDMPIVATNTFIT